MGDISAHLNRKEIACECGCGKDTFDVETAMLFEIVRELNGNKPITISGGNRCAAHNTLTGGSPQSQHIKCRALDIPVDNPPFVYALLCRMFPDMYGFGLYHNRVHVDSRAKMARWEHG